MATESDLRGRLDGRTVDYKGKHVISVLRLEIPEIPQYRISANLHLFAGGDQPAGSFMVHVTTDTLEDFDRLWDCVIAGVVNRVDGVDGQREYF